MVAIDPETGLVLSVVVASAPASTSASPLGGVAPPDQVMEAMVALTVVTSKAVKVSVPEETVSKCVLPVVLTVSVAVETSSSPQHRREICAAAAAGSSYSGAGMNPALAAVI